MDEIDRAQQREQEDRDRAIADALAHSQGRKGSTVCKVCDDLMDPRRTALGLDTCFECQTRIEAKVKTGDWADIHHDQDKYLDRRAKRLAGK